MNELDRLRDDLHAEPDVPFGPPDLAAVMGTGRRIRRRRQLTAASATGLAVVAVAGLVISVGRLSTAPVSPAAPASAVPSVIATPSTPEPRVTPPQTGSPTPTFGKHTVRTGVMLAEGEFALVVEAIDLEAAPDVRFGVSASVIRPNGEVKPLVTSSEYQGSDVSPGFHAGYQTTMSGVNQVPMFGYYAGPAAQITGRTADGSAVDSTRSPAKIDGDLIVLYWFDPATAGAGPITDMLAYDDDGVQLPTGHNVAGHG
jgi:hypothetical protein